MGCSQTLLLHPGHPITFLEFEYSHLPFLQTCAHWFVEDTSEGPVWKDMGSCRGWFCLYNRKAKGLLKWHVFYVLFVFVLYIHLYLLKCIRQGLFSLYITATAPTQKQQRECLLWLSWFFHRTFCIPMPDPPYNLKHGFLKAVSWISGIIHGYKMDFPVTHISFGGTGWRKGTPLKWNTPLYLRML